MPTIYSTIYSNFIRQGSTFAKSITTNGYAQSVVAATHPHALNAQNRPVFGRRHTGRLGRLSAFQHYTSFHSERIGTSFSSDPRHGHLHGGLDAYFEALQQKQATGEVEKEWTQFEFPKRIEWKPSSSAILVADEMTTADPELDFARSSDTASSYSIQEEAAFAHVDAALEKEIHTLDIENNAQDSRPAHSSDSAPHASTQSQTLAPRSTDGNTTPEPADVAAQSYTDQLSQLSREARFAEIPAVFEAMLASGIKPLATGYNALLRAAIHLPTKKIEIVSKALEVYADMVRRRVTPNGDTYNILVGLLASRSLEVSVMKTALEDKCQRFGGIEEPGKFIFASHELEHAILCEDDRLDLAIKLFNASVDAHTATYSAETYHQVISACAKTDRFSDMLRLFEHMESSKSVPYAAVFPTMITAFATRGDLVGAVECYNEYRSLAMANDRGLETLRDRLDTEVYAAVINAYVITNKIGGAMKFFQRIITEYGVCVADIKDVLISKGFVEGFISRGIHTEALQWALTIEAESRAGAMGRITTVAADRDDKVTATEAYAHIAASPKVFPTPTIAMLAMSIRKGDIISARKYWHTLTRPGICATADFIEPSVMFAIAMIGSGQVAEGLSQSEMMFEQIKASGSRGQPQLSEEVEEGVDFIQRFMQARGIADARELTPAPSNMVSQTMQSSFPPKTTTRLYADNYDPYAHTTDFKVSSLIADDLEGNQFRRGPRLDEALERLRNVRRVGKHPRYITYAKLISAATRKGKNELCHDILTMARDDVPLLPQYTAVRYGWSSILDAMVGACLSMGNRGRAEQYHQELLEIGFTPTANTFGLYITTLRESIKSFDEASEAMRIFHRAKSEGVEPSSFLYNALIGKLGKARRIDDCLFYFAEMRYLGIKPTSVTYGTVVNALCRVSDEKLAEELFDEMEAMPNYKARPAPYNSMIQFFLTTKRDKSKVLAYYDRMKARDIAATSHTYKLLIDAHATLDPVDMKAAEKVMDCIRASGQGLEPVHYASLIHARGCVLHDMQGARKLFDRVVDEFPALVNASVFQALFEAMVANHKVEETEPLLAQMRENGVKLTAYIANTLIHGWAAAKNIGKAQAIFEAVAREQREPSTYEAMTRAFLAVKKKEEAKGVAGEMLTRGYPHAVVNKVLELLGGVQEARTECAEYKLGQRLGSRSTWLREKTDTVWLASLLI